MQKKLNRRTFMKLTAACSMAGLIPNITNCANKKSTRPNIIFILADDLGYGDLGCYGQKKIKTPNIDQLANEGMLFTQCYAGATVCAPSRSTLMTGQHTGHTRVRANKGKVGGIGPERRVPLVPEDVTVAEVLKKANYVTGITGKWGLGEPDSDGIPNRQGFDEWFGYLNQKKAHSYYPTYLWRNEEKEILHGNADGKKQQYTHDMFTEYALDFIGRHKEKPFFLYLPYTVPHAKYEIPDLGIYKEKDWPEDAKVHAAMITLLDTDVGRIISLLKELNLDQNTIVFFCSDNGAARRWEGLFDSSGILRGRKRDMYDGGIRTPMIVRYPKKIPAGVVSEQIWYFPDVLPTMADLAGVESPGNIDGISLLPTLMGKDQDISDRYLYWEIFEPGFRQAARRGKWKVVRSDYGKPLELFDLSVDPSEKTNVANEHPAVIRDFEVFMKTARTESPNWPLNA